MDNQQLFVKIGQPTFNYIKFLKVGVIMEINKQFVDDMILGSVLGDGSLEKPGSLRKNYLISFTQNSKDEKEKEYINLKHDLIEKYYKVNKVRPKHNNTYYFSISTKEKELTDYILHLSRYNDNKRKLPDIEKITPVVMLFWYLDDGSLSIGIQKRPNGRNSTISRRLKISLSSYKDKDILKFIEDFKTKFNIEFKTSKDKGKIVDIHLRKKEEITKFLDLILPYKDIIPDKQYYKFCLCETNENYIKYNNCNFDKTGICTCRNKSFVNLVNPFCKSSTIIPEMGVE